MLQHVITQDSSNHLLRDHPPSRFQELPLLMLQEMLGEKWPGMNSTFSELGARGKHAVEKHGAKELGI